MLLLAAALSGCGRGQEEKSPKPEEEKTAECREPEVQEQVQKDREDSADSAKEESPKVSEGVFSLQIQTNECWRSRRQYRPLSVCRISTRKLFMGIIPIGMTLQSMKFMPDTDMRFRQKI